MTQFKNRSELCEIDQELAVAIDNYDWEAVKNCLKSGADIDCQNGYALSSAVWQHNLEMVQYLLTSPELTNHANININPKNLSLICINNFRHQNEIFEYLLFKGLDLQMHARENLHAAITRKTPDALIFLHKAGVDIQLLNDLPFRVALEKERYDTLDYLLDNGVDIHRNNELALREAIENNNHTLADYLISREADLFKAYEHSGDNLRKKIESFRLERELNSSLPNKDDKNNKLKI